MEADGWHAARSGLMAQGSELAFPPAGRERAAPSWELGLANGLEEGLFSFRDFLAKQEHWDAFPTQIPAQKVRTKKKFVPCTNRFAAVLGSSPRGGGSGGAGFRYVPPTSQDRQQSAWQPQ